MIGYIRFVENGSKSYVTIFSVVVNRVRSRGEGELLFFLLSSFSFNNTSHKLPSSISDLIELMLRAYILRLIFHMNCKSYSKLHIDFLRFIFSLITMVSSTSFLFLLEMWVGFGDNDLSIYCYYY